MILATVFSFENDFPREIQDYFIECTGYVFEGSQTIVYFPLNWNADCFFDTPVNVLEAYTEVVRYIKANLHDDVEYAYIDE